jgi:Uma2 family endonuclease
MARTALEAKAAPSPGRMTWEEFVAWCDEDTWAEWVDGEVIVLSPASIAHQQLMAFLVFLLRLFVRTHDLGVLLSAPTLMRLASRPSGREPDLLFVAKEHLDRLRATWIEGPADLVVEIVSPDSVERDWETKLEEYAAGGVPEYWVLDRDRRDAAFFQLGEDGRYVRAPLEEGSIYRSQVLPGFWLRVEWLWQLPPPDLEAAAALDLLRR